MGGFRIISLCVGLSMASMLVGCGGSPVPVSERSGAPSVHLADELAPIAGPVTARAALTYAHGVAQQLDAKAMFTSLAGVRIGRSGVPIKDGRWEIYYVGGKVANGDTPYNPLVRRILVTVDNTGRPSITERAEPGMPLGVAYAAAPLPAVDSRAALDIVREHAKRDHRLFALSLSGSVTAQQTQRLLWRVTPLTQNVEKPVQLDANSGELLPAR